MAGPFWVPSGPFLRIARSGLISAGGSSRDAGPFWVPFGDVSRGTTGASAVRPTLVAEALVALPESLIALPGSLIALPESLIALPESGERWSSVSDGTEPALGVSGSPFRGVPPAPRAMASSSWSLSSCTPPRAAAVTSSLATTSAARRRSAGLASGAPSTSRTACSASRRSSASSLASIGCSTSCGQVVARSIPSEPRSAIRASLLPIVTVETDAQKYGFAS